MIQINGIRLSREMIQVCQKYPRGSQIGFTPVHRRLSQDRINMICAGTHSISPRTRGSCCLEKKHLKTAEAYGEEGGWDASLSEVCIVSVYPHHSNVQILLTLLQIFNRTDIRFRHMVSSNAMISFVIETRFQEEIVSCIRKEALLPDSHTPFRQDLEEDISHLLKKYPETRSTYVEEKIKTYGINIYPALDLFYLNWIPGNSSSWEPALESLKKSGVKFLFASAMTSGDISASARDFGYEFVFLTAGPTDPLIGQTENQHAGLGESDGQAKADLISFHGPHFGDRYRILDTALSCMDKAGLPILLTGCTGASISMVLPAGMGQRGKQALSEGFEAP